MISQLLVYVGVEMIASSFVKIRKYFALTLVFDKVARV